MGYDPQGTINWGGVAIGLGCLALGAILVASTVASFGATSPLVAGTLCTLISTSVELVAGTAVAATGAEILTAAATDSVAVIDCSLSIATEKNGLSMVVDFGNNTGELYQHKGHCCSDPFCMAYSVGTVFDYDQLGDYSGEFVEASCSFSSFGVSYSQDPNKEPFCGARAACFTFSTPSFKCSPGASYDIYESITSWSF